MENKEIQTVINGQPDERPIADEIKNVLYKSPDSDEWRRDFESQWQCVIFVLYQPSLTGAEPSAVDLVVIPSAEEDEFYFAQFSFRVRLVGVQDAVGVWPAIERLGQRLSEIGRLLKAIRYVLGLVHTDAQEQALRILFNRPLKKWASNASGTLFSKKRVAQTRLRSDCTGQSGLFAGHLAHFGRTYPRAHA